MTRPVVADTDLVIDYLRGKGDGVDAVTRWIGSGQLRLTAVTAYELRVGGDFLRREHRIARLLAGRTLPFDAEAALHAGAIWGELAATGQGIGLADTLQAGIARRFGIPLATRNTSHFSRVTDLELQPVTG
ncbi:MAG: type II toxin-antitoxin system VapC family toxin [Acidimicrobiales bacterium]